MRLFAKTGQIILDQIKNSTMFPKIDACSDAKHLSRKILKT